MHRIVGKSIYLTRLMRAAVYSPTKICSSLYCLQSPKLLFANISNITSSTNNKQSSFTVRDLINSRELSPKIVIRLESSKRPDSVLKFLENEGFSSNHIQIIVSKYPQILFNSVEKTLKPKIDLFRSVGFSEADLLKMITMVPHVLHKSVEKHLTPYFDVLTTLLGGQQNVINAIKRLPSILCGNIAYLAPNVEILRNIGTPNSRIIKMVTQSLVVLGTAPHRFRKIVAFVEEMGFDPSSSSFQYAIKAKGYGESSWESRFTCFRSLCFSDEEIIYMFKKQPITLISSNDKTRAAVEFYVNKFHWSPSQLSKKPNVLLYSLEKRIIPRCAVLQILASRGMINRNVKVSTILTMIERDFFEKYVNNYKDEAPELLDAYKGKLKFDGYNFDSGSK